MLLSLLLLPYKSMDVCVCFTYMQSVNGTTMYECMDMFVCPYRFCLYFIQRCCCCCLYAWQNIKFHVYSTKHLCILQQPHLPSALRNKFTTNVNDGDQKEHIPIPIYTHTAARTSTYMHVYSLRVKIIQPCALNNVTVVSKNCGELV